MSGAGMMLCSDPTCPHPTPHYFTRPQDGVPTNFEAMWEDAKGQRDVAEARARGYQDRLRAIEALVCPTEEGAL